MPKTRFTIAGVFFRAVAASMLGTAMLAVPAAVASTSTSACAPSGKCFAVKVSPTSTPPAGATVSFGFAITNEASTQQLGSVQITAPTITIRRTTKFLAFEATSLQQRRNSL